MKKRSKKKKGLFDLKVRFIIDENFVKHKPGPYELEKLARANESLKGMKLPK